MNDKWHQGIGRASCDEHRKNRISHSSDREPSDGQPRHSVRAFQAEKRGPAPALEALIIRGCDAILLGASFSSSNWLITTAVRNTVGTVEQGWVGSARMCVAPWM